MATFKESFASARKAGKKTFKWNGKLYTTELKKDGEATSSPRPKARPDTSSAPSSSPRPQARPDTSSTSTSTTKAPTTRRSPTEEMKKKNDAGTASAPTSSTRPAPRPGGPTNAELSAAAKAAKAAGKPFSAMEFRRKYKIKG